MTFGTLNPLQILLYSETRVSVDNHTLLLGGYLRIPPLEK